MERDSVTLDEVDRKLLHALHVDARAPFSRIGDVLGVSDRTVARRYARLRDAKVINLVGLADPQRLDGAEWVVRMQCEPGSALRVGEALARRDDTRWVALLSGGTEISASLRTWSAGERDELILQRLHRTAPVVSVTAHSVLNVFSTARHGFEGRAPLTAGQIAALLPDHGADSADPTDADRPLLDALALDGRLPYPALAAVTGWSESTVARRVHALRASGVLRFDLDVDAVALGFHTQAHVWAGVPLAHLAKTGAAVAAHPEVAFCAATTGPANLLISVICRDDRDLYRYLVERLGALPHLGEVQTAPVIRVVKRAGRRP
ncbi:Lrp/AsnC family transcriptional regulator [Amycolatopsis sp., V23-08]|uniref:Lrp/AsnC family transcriptional regulator n=1 Tax=Amycolatopsis heterodermiae TaxID=3110235 RepID=A0ABU5R3P7_9PSEU|nr:Lrp/AsnC family transcriptional regulator [Amycolatopsis sp., V23-08]MEA5360817.1 Lrp/AsnC family transcriptional regulator [Amycolatopsis sp., V23-08]